MVFIYLQARGTSDEIYFNRKDIISFVYTCDIFIKITYLSVKYVEQSITDAYVPTIASRQTQEVYFSILYKHTVERELSSNIIEESLRGYGAAGLCPSCDCFLTIV